MTRSLTVTLLLTLTACGAAERRSDESPDARPLEGMRAEAAKRLGGSVSELGGGLFIASRRSLEVEGNHSFLIGREGGGLARQSDEAALAKVLGPIRSPARALLACRLRCTGFLVSDAETLKRLQAAYASFDYPFGGQSFYGEVQALPPPLSLSIEAAGDGYRVSFTAFLLERGMGAPATLCRPTWQVSAAGEVKELARVTYHVGPALNWQIAISGDSQDRERQIAENRALHKQVARLVRTALSVGDEVLPPGRPPVSAP